MNSKSSSYLWTQLTNSNSPISTRHLISLVVACLLLGFFTLTFAFSPLNGEDYALTAQLDSLSAADRILWIIQRSALQITTWNARFGEQLSIFWLSIPEIFFTLANTLAFFAFSALIAMFAVEEKYWSASRLGIATFAAIALCYVFWPRMELFFWRTTAAGYLQPLVLTLAIALLFHSERARAYSLESNTRVAIAIILCFIGGCSFENIPPALIPYLAILAALRFRRKRADGPYMAAYMAAYLAGWAVLMLMPSTEFRTNWYRTHMGTPPISISYLLHQTAQIINVFLGATKGLLTALALTLIWCTVRYKANPLRNTDIVLLSIPAILCGGALLISPYIEPRAFSIAWILGIISIVRLTDKYIQRHSPRLYTLLLVGLSISAISAASIIFRDYLQFSQKVNARMEFIASEAHEGRCQSGIRIPIIQTNSDIRILNNREEWVRDNPGQISTYFKCKILIEEQ
ncbi:DUF6056 family protein [Pseudomonas sp. LABIM340]|uniref:DUF6056 family protein n=1 Tax=Pseudomonas sp. LABIM340 TaxID=3156585 RepID=UPI0032AFAA97